MIRLLFLFISCFFTISFFSQVSDSFSDNDYTTNPPWTISASTDFTVTGGQLKSANTTTNSNFYISTTNTLATNCQWEFYANLQFNTSSANFADVYLVSDASNLQSASINGYFVRIGGTLDEICLYKRNGALASAVKIIDGADGVANVSNNLLKIKVTRTATNQFTLERDITGTSNSYVSEGSVTDGAFTNSVAFGFYIAQSTASFFGKHIFDDINVGPVILDVTPPALVSATAINNTAIDVLFNENVDAASSQTANNYTLSPGGISISSATRDASNFKLVHLTTGSNLVSGTNYTLEVNAVQDLAANSMSLSVINFNYFAFGTPAFKDIVINEIYADPSPLVNLTSAEFVELYNRGTSPFNISGLKLTDNSSIATLGNYTLAPNSYVIICPVADTAQFTNLGYTNKLGVSSFPSLNNSGDNLYLKTAANAFIDSVNYKDTWYRDAIKKDGGWTLEQINPNLNVNCSQAGNWIASTDADGGTPGFVNSVYSVSPDLTGPKISAVSVIDGTHISVCFDDLIQSSQLTVPSSYTISTLGSPIATAVTGGNYCVTLSLNAPLVNATNYTISIGGITDCNGNALNPNSGTFSYYQHQTRDVVINEIMCDPDPAINLPNEEYVELKNRTAFNINLKNWSIATPSTSKKLPDITIRPDSFIVLTGSGNASQFFNNFGIIVYEVTSFPSLTNSGSTLTLRDSNGVVISSVSYSSGWYQDVNKEDGGWSLEQIDANNPCGGQNNWHACTHPNGGTPGSRNSVAANNPDLNAPVASRAIVVNADTIAIFFTEPLDSASLANPANYSFDNGLGTPAYIKPVASSFTKVVIKLSAMPQNGIVYHCNVLSGIVDCAGNSLTAGTVAFALPEPASPGDVVINEILSDPATGGVDFVELYNKSSKTIDLRDLRIGSMDTINNILKDTEIITEEGYLLFPETYLVISESGTAVKQQYQTTNPSGFLDVADLPGMNIDDDVVTLSDKNTVVIDNLIYTSKMHFPLLVSTKGVSLERIDFTRETNDRTNWNSASQGVGFATPAYRNSQYLQANGGDGVSISNPLFSPDNDGYNDVLNISYKLDEPGKAANIIIYDSKGREVKHLVRNQQLAQDGTISWNGINDDNEKAPIGIYVIYVELFNTAGKVSKHKLTCTLAGKL